MTVNKIHKILEKLIQRGEGRTQLCIDKRSFTSPLESDGVVYIQVEDVAPKSVPMIDDDGGTKWDSRGREVHKSFVCLYGMPAKDMDAYDAQSIALNTKEIPNE